MSNHDKEYSTTEKVESVNIGIEEEGNTQSSALDTDTATHKRQGGKFTSKDNAMQQKMQSFVDNLPNKKQCFDSASEILFLILPFLRIVLDENIFRFLLGILASCTNISRKQIAECAGCSVKTVQKGKKAVQARTCPDFRRVRAKGAGRKKLLETIPCLKQEIMKFVELRSYGPCTKGTQEYTAATADGIRQMLARRLGKKVSSSAIYLMLISWGIRLRTNKKLLYGNEGKETEAQKAIRHLQFDYIYSVREKASDSNCIVLSMDCKKKEILGPFARQGGSSYTLPGQPLKVNEHDFMIPLDISSLKDMDDLLDRQEGKAIPYGIYDLGTNKAYVSVGISHDTPEFVAASLYRFIDRIRQDHPAATILYLLCDGGGSNNSRSKAFKYQIALLSRKIGMKIVVVHYPPYRSKFNPIERKLFAYISKRFERTVLYNLRTVLDEINHTVTKNGLKVIAELDTGIYELKQKPSPAQMELVKMRYVGTNDNSITKLSYIIDGTESDDLDIPDVRRMTVFDLRNNNAKKEEDSAINSTS